MSVLSGKEKKLPQVQCYHCGENCGADAVKQDEKQFCCEGCMLVYELLAENNLCTYYDLNRAPGASLKAQAVHRYEYLDQESVKEKLLSYADERQAHIAFYIPSIHCSSCIWLLENLHRLHPGVKSSTVDFLKKEAKIVYGVKEIKLSELVALMASVGYEPLLSLENLETKKESRPDRSKVLKIGIAGFCFGNIMMLSFPEYFAGGDFFGQPELKKFFSILNLLLSLPVLLYAASDFFVSAWNGIKQRFLNIDLPIAFAVLVTFLRSVYDVLSSTGPGYFDSMSGIVFFMLLGRYFQDVTYKKLSFDRDYRSYFPIAVSIRQGEKEMSIPVSELRKGDNMLIRNGELIPVDAILLSPHTYIDYSFVTGESRPVKKLQGELIYAGGREVEGTAELLVTEKISQSYLTGLWNKAAREKEEEPHSFIHLISKYFTFGVLLTAMLSFLFWSTSGNVLRGVDALTAVLIVACPCALLLSATFTNGNILRIFGRNGFYLKNAQVIERLSKTDTIILDKTGTLTYGSAARFVGIELSSREYGLAASLAGNSLHPLSRKIREQYAQYSRFPVSEYKEIPGSGIRGFVDGSYVVMGSAYFVTGNKRTERAESSNVFLRIDGELKGFFSIRNSYREGVDELVAGLKKQYDVRLLSGDNDSEKETLKSLFPDKNDMMFDQLPEDKSAFIRSLRNKGRTVTMVGDGLNDSAALSCSNTGIAVADDSSVFSPSSDAILSGASFGKLDKLIAFAKTGKRLILATFVLSIVYNVVGLFFAVQGTLTPVVAAILMPASSISIVLFSTLFSRLLARTKGL